MRCLFVLDLVILFCLFFSLAAKLIGARTGRQFFKNVDFLDLHPIKKVKLLCCVQSRTQFWLRGPKHLSEGRFSSVWGPGVVFTIILSSTKNSYL